MIREGFVNVICEIKNNQNVNLGHRFSVNLFALLKSSVGKLKVLICATRASFSSSLSTPKSLLIPSIMFCFDISGFMIFFNALTSEEK